MVIATHTLLHAVREVGIAVYCLVLGFTAYVTAHYFRRMRMGNGLTWMWRTVVWLEVNTLLLVAANLGLRLQRELQHAPETWIDYVGLGIGVSVLLAQWRVARRVRIRGTDA